MTEEEAAAVAAVVVCLAVVSVELVEQAEPHVHQSVAAAEASGAALTSFDWQLLVDRVRRAT